MHDNPTTHRGRFLERLALDVCLTVLLRQADRLPWESPARRALAEATFPIREALDRLDEAARIDADRALQLASAAVDTGVATWTEDGSFRAEPLLRTRLAELGVSVLPQLRD